jgi:hypothetical protein
MSNESNNSIKKEGTLVSETLLSYGKSLSERKSDIFFVCCFCFFAFSSFFSDAQHGLNLLHGDGFWAQANIWYAKIAGDVFFLQDLPYVRFATLVSGLIYGPFYLVLVYAFIKGSNWIRLPALIYVGAMLHGMSEFIYWEYRIGPAPTNFIVFWAFNLPYALVPVLLGIRMRHHMPFGTDENG